MLTQTRMCKKVKKVKDKAVPDMMESPDQDPDMSKNRSTPDLGVFLRLSEFSGKRCK